jgi:guanylate kinase
MSPATGSGRIPKDASKAKGVVFVIAAPSGTGKTTICQQILSRDARLRLSISHTTRRARTSEEDGVHYQFVSEKAFRELREAKAFLEHAEYGGNAYGTSWAAIEGPLEFGRDVVLEIEVQGAAQVRERMPTACLIFLLPPSLDVLEARLRARGTDDEDVIQRRMALVDRELAAAKIFDYLIVNDELDMAVDQVLEVIGAIREGRGDEIRSTHGRPVALARWSELQSS